MAEPIRREDAALVNKKLEECRRLISRGNIFPCLINFREALEKILSIRMLPADEKQLHDKINALQQELAESAAFKKIYGPVTFRDDDMATSLDFLKQLIRIKEEELQAVMEERQNTESERQIDEDGSLPEGDAAGRAEKARSLIDRGRIDEARELISEDEDVISFLVGHYNSAGIGHRKEGKLDEALAEFRKALLVAPGDEGLHYNVARVHVERKEWELARTSILKALGINPEFRHGLALLKHIEENR